MSGGPRAECTWYPRFHQRLDLIPNRNDSTQKNSVDNLFAFYSRPRILILDRGTKVVKEAQLVAVKGLSIHKR